MQHPEPASASTERVQSQFGAVASAYVTSSYHANGPDLAALVREADFNGSEQVLDLGCGAGHMALAAAPHVDRVIGVDVTPHMVEVSTRLAAERGVGNVTFQVADVSRLPFEDGRFDVLTSRVSAHHYADPARALAEAFRVLKPGGSLLLIDTVAPEEPALDTFFNCVELLRDASHGRNWRCSEWLRMVAEAGFAGGAVVERFAVWLDGREWVERMRTPAARVAMLRQLFAEATPAQRDAFGLRTEEPWGLTIPIALIGARKP